MTPEHPPLPPNIISLCSPWLPKNEIQGHFSIYCRLFPPGALSNSLRNLLEVSCNIFHTIIYLRNLLECTALVTLTIRVLQRQFSYEMAFMTGMDFFWIQFIRTQGLLFKDVISCILLSKNFFLAFLTIALNAFQCWRSPDKQYLLRLMEQSWFHYSFEYFVMRFSLKCLFHAFSNM